MARSKEAFELLIKNYRTEQSGLVYSHSSPRPQVQFLVRELGEFLEGLRQEAKIGESPGLGLADLILCLDWLGSKVDFQLKRQGGAGRDYLKLVARSHPGESTQSFREADLSLKNHQFRTFGSEPGGISLAEPCRR